MYRLMLADAPTWSTGVAADLECGPVNQTVIRARSVAYYYSAPSRDVAAGEGAPLRP
jgi:hypothetical protein